MVKKTVFTGVALTAAVAVAGCGGSTNNNSSSSAAKASTPAAKSQGAAATGGTSAAATSGPVEVKLSEWAVVPSTTHVKAGKVTFKATDVGQMPHEMIVLRTGKPAQDLGKGTRIPETGHVGEIGGLKKGQTSTVTLHLKKGHYAIVCNEPGHYTAGMHANLEVS